MDRKRRITLQRLVAAFASVAMVWSLVPTATIAQEDSSPAAIEAQAEHTSTVTVRVIDGAGAELLAAKSVSFEEGTSAWDASKAALDAANLAYDYTSQLESVTRPDGTVVTNDGSYHWSLFVNGSEATVDAAQLAPAKGDALEWRYVAFTGRLDAQGDGEAAATGNSEDGTETTNDESAADNGTSDAGAEADGSDAGTGTDAGTGSDDGNSSSDSTTGNDTVAVGRFMHTSIWSAYRNGIRRGVTDGYGHGTIGRLKWQDSADGTAISEPISVDDDVYVAVDNQIRILDGADGKVLKSQQLDGSIANGTRLVYDDDEGIVMIPLSGGRVQAVYVDGLGKVWTSDAVAQDAADVPSLGTGIAKDGIAYFQTGTGEPSTSGYITAIKVADGTLAWTAPYHNTSSGYAWTGPAFAGNALVIADESGTVYAHDVETGEVLDSLPLGSAVQSVTASNDDGTAVYVVTRDDGTLHKIEVSQDGKLSEANSLPFATHSISTPTVSNGKIFVGGCDENGMGILVVIDEKGFTIEKTIDAAEDADGAQANIASEVKSAPLVVIDSYHTRTVVYFCASDTPGAIYAYEVGDDVAKVLYTPEEGNERGGSQSPIATVDGCVVFVNGSGRVLKIQANIYTTKPSEHTTTPNLTFTVEPPEIESSVGGQYVSRGKVITFTIYQDISDDDLVSSMALWCDVDPALQLLSSESTTKVQVAGGGVKYDGNRVIATLGNPDLTNLSAKAAASDASSSETSEESDTTKSATEEDTTSSDDDATSDGSALVAQGDATSEESVNDFAAGDVADTTKAANGSEVTFSFTAKVREDVDLGPYMREGDDSTAYIPYVAKVRFNNSDELSATSEAVKYLKVKVSNSDQPAKRTPTAPAPARTATPKTGDQTMGVTAIVVAALVVLGVGVVLHRRRSRSEK